MELRRRWSALLACLMVVVLCGCPQKPPESAAPQGAGAVASSKPATVTLTDQEGRPAPPFREGATGFEGRWSLFLSSQGQDIVLWLFEISRGPENAWSGKFLDASRDRTKPEFTRVAVDGEQIQFDVKNEQGTVNFQGRLVDGVVRGTFAFGPYDLSPARLWPTSIDSLEKSAQALPPPGIDVFKQAAAEKEKPVAAILRAAQEAYDSPLALDAYSGVLEQLRRVEPTRAQAEKIVGGYAKSAATWGPRMELRSRIISAVQLTRNRLFPDMVLSLLKEFEQGIGDELSNWKDQIKAARTNALVEQAMLDLRSGDEAKRTAARDYLSDPKLTTQHYNFEVLYELARYSADHDETDKAIDYYSQIVALPLLEMMVKEMGPQIGRAAGDPTPRDVLTELWEKSRGSRDGLDAHLRQVYEQSLGGLIANARERAPAAVAAPTRPVLLELFTGTECGPCIAADLATWGVQQTYSDKDVIVLQIHQHIPLPDPLANLDGEERYSYYEAQGTPWAMIDGMSLQGERGLIPSGIGGLLQQVEMNYLQLRNVIDQRLVMSPGAQVSATAALQDGLLTVSAGATGFSTDDSGALRLRVALVERQVDYAGTNGIRDHHHVLRAMLGGARGAAVRKGELKYDTSIPLAELRQQIESYLAEFEAGRRIKFPVKPLELKSLEVAAWVQNDKTKEVLGSVLIPVAGASAPESAPAVPAAQEPANASAPANGAPTAP